MSSGETFKGNQPLEGPGEGNGKLMLVGLGPGDEGNLTMRARAALAEAQMVIGFRGYIEQVRDLISPNARVEPSEITHEVERAESSVALARAGSRVALVCSGDSGIYALAGLALEILADQGWRPGQTPRVEVIPGVSALNSAAALLGAPLMHDFCTISLSDLLTPWEIIRDRIEAAALADFVICLYNPRSQKRTWQLGEARRILMQSRPGTTPVGIVRNAYRPGQFSQVTTLEGLAGLEQEVEMNTVVVVGNKSSFALDGLIITPRGYKVEKPASPEEVKPQ